MMIIDLEFLYLPIPDTHLATNHKGDGDSGYTNRNGDGYSAGLEDRQQELNDGDGYGSQHGNLSGDWQKYGII